MTSPAKVIGRVMDADGNPIQDANVVVVCNRSFQRHPIDVELTEARGIYENPCFAVTDIDGKFAIDDEKLEPGSLSVSVVADGFAPLRSPHEEFPGDSTFDLGDLSLDNGKSIGGLVLDESGNPLSEVLVLLAIDRGVPGCFQSYPGRGIPLTQTDSDGRFKATGLLPGRWLLIFDKPGYSVAQRQGNFFNDPSPDDLNITLDRGSTISGRVTNVPSEVELPLMVEARPIRRGVDYCKQFPSRARPRRALVQPDGTFQIGGLNESEFEPMIKPFVMQGYHPECTTDNGELDVWLVVGHSVEPNRPLVELPEIIGCRVPAGSIGVELPWLGRASFSARVVDEEGSAVENFHAELRHASGFGPVADPHEIVKLSNGQIEIRDYGIPEVQLQYWQPEQKVWLAIRSNGFQNAEIEIQEHLIRGQQSDFGDVVLQRAPAIPMRVVDFDGNPIAGAEIRLASKKFHNFVSMAYQNEVPDPMKCLVFETDKEGKAVLSEVAKGAEIISVSHTDYSFYVKKIEAPSEESTEKKQYPSEIRLGPAGKVKVKVTDASGIPTEGRRVFAQTAPADEETSDPTVGFQVKRYTDDSGEAVFDQLNNRFLIGLKHPEEKWRPDSEISDSERTTVEVDANEVEAKLTAWPLHDFSVAIRESDRPVHCAKLKLMSAFRETPKTDYYETAWPGYTDDRGHFQFRAVPSGDYFLQLKQDDRNMVNRLKIQVGPDMEPIEWLLDNISISGRLVDAQGNPLAFKRLGIRTPVAGYCQRNNDGITYENGTGGLSWFWSNQAVHETWTDAEGNFHLRGLVAEIPISLYTRHGQLNEKEMELEPLKPGEQREGIEFVTELSGKTGWRP